MRLLLFLGLLGSLNAAAVPPSPALTSRLAEAAAPYRFDFVDWMSSALADEIGRRWQPPPAPARQIEQRALVEQFLDLEQQIRDTRRRLDQLYTARIEPDAAIDSLEAQLIEAEVAQARLIPQVETILRHQVEAVLQAEGFTLNGAVFTPVAFRLIDPPTALIISPRDRIERVKFVGLQPGLTPGQRAEIEARLDRRGDVVSYITDIGGLGSYPTMVITHPSLPYLVEVIAHEWTHNYFFSFPSHMAWGYDTYPKLATLNETTADIAGKEIGRKVISNYYPDLIEQLPPLDNTGQPAPGQPSEFDLAMRRIRLRVDQLLAAGKIHEAEHYMETERLKLVAKGYNLRKLNQAYFAFHGAYAASPASVDPAGAQLRRLRAESGSLKSFVDRVGWLNSYEEFLVWLAVEGTQ